MPTVLISGASTGIGRATALRLAASGWSVLAGVRSGAAGEELAAQASTDGRAEGRTGGRVVPVELDITNPAQVAAAAGLVHERTGEAGLDALVNNAGVALGGPVEMLTLAQLREQFEVNFFGHVAVTKALLGALRRARGRLVLISSIGGRITTPYMSPYNASKYALEALGDSLRVELASSHIQVALIEPGSIATPIWDKGNELIDGIAVPAELQQYYGHVPSAMEKTLRSTAKRGIPPERVAQTIESALGARRMRARYLVGVDAHMMLWLSRVLPDRALDRVLRRAVGI
jgi:NAD(P)-dependent dehydrogenase (short-subunit alcohol dehydrogenase family)